MADGSTTTAQAQAGQSERHSSWPSTADVGPEPKGYGWVLFAGIMLGIAGILNFVYGIAAIDRSSFYLGGAHYVFGDLKAWGWTVMFLGVLETCVAFGIWIQAGWARWTGVVIAGLNAIAQLMFLPSYPLLSLTIFAVDLLVIYGLASYGGRPHEA